MYTKVTEQPPSHPPSRQDPTLVISVSSKKHDYGGVSQASSASFQNTTGKSQELTSLQCCTMSDSLAGTFQGPAGTSFRPGNSSSCLRPPQRRAEKRAGLGLGPFHPPGPSRSISSCVLRPRPLWQKYSPLFLGMVTHHGWSHLVIISSPTS